MAKTIPVRIFIKDTDTNEIRNWDDLSEKEKDSFQERMSQNLSKGMSRYFSENPDEYERL
jgi:hypothetical protein